jgi:hypothetical protein
MLFYYELKTKYHFPKNTYGSEWSMSEKLSQKSFKLNDECEGLLKTPKQ